MEILKRLTEMRADEAIGFAILVGAIAIALFGLILIGVMAAVILQALAETPWQYTTAVVTFVAVVGAIVVAVSRFKR